MTKNEKEENAKIISKEIKRILDDAKTEDDENLRFIFLLLMIEAIKGKTRGFADSDIKVSVCTRHGRSQTFVIELPGCY